MAEAINRIRDLDPGRPVDHAIIPLRERSALARPDKKSALSDRSDAELPAEAASAADPLQVLDAGAASHAISGHTLAPLMVSVSPTWTAGSGASEVFVPSGSDPDVSPRHVLVRSEGDTSRRLLTSIHASAAPDTTDIRSPTLQPGLALSSSSLIRDNAPTSTQQKINKVSGESGELHDIAFLQSDLSGAPEPDDASFKSLAGHEKLTLPMAAGAQGNGLVTELTAHPGRPSADAARPVMHAYPSRGDVAGQQPATGAARTSLTYAFTSWTGQPFVTANLGRRQLIASSAGVRGGLREALGTAPGSWRVEQTAGDDSDMGGRQDDKP